MDQCVFQDQQDDKGSLSGVLRSKIIPVYVWSPVIGHCTKTCGNGKQTHPFYFKFRIIIVYYSCVSYRTVHEFLICGYLGTQQIWFSCVDHQSRLDVPEFLCDRFSKPEPYIKPCAQSPCPATYVFTNHSSTSIGSMIIIMY